jgi:hypothetical protein
MRDDINSSHKSSSIPAFTNSSLRTSEGLSAKTRTGLTEESSGFKEVIDTVDVMKGFYAGTEKGFLIMMAKILFGFQEPRVIEVNLKGNTVYKAHSEIIKFLFLLHNFNHK